VKATAQGVARSSFTLWAAFILAHLWLGLLNLYGPGYPMGDVTSVYKFWVDQLVINDFQVGIDSQWVYPILAFVPMLAALAFGSTLYASTWLSIVMLLNVTAFGILTGWGRRRDHNADARRRPAQGGQSRAGCLRRGDQHPFSPESAVIGEPAPFPAHDSRRKDRHSCEERAAQPSRQHTQRRQNGGRQDAQGEGVSFRGGQPSRHSAARGRETR